MTTFHITPEGPKVCTAKYRCKYGNQADHFDNKKEAVAVFEKGLSAQHGSTSTRSRKRRQNPPSYDTVDNVDKNAEQKEEQDMEDEAEKQNQQWLEDRDKNVELTYQTLTPREFDVNKDDNVVIPEDLREKLKEEIADGYVNTSFSEDGRYVMLKYSKNAMFDQRWNEVTVNFRGVLTDPEYRRVFARSFPKFFNVAEHETREGFPELPKHEQVVLATKMDGSLGLVANVDGENRVFTSGSAGRETNDIASEGESILQEVLANADESDWKPPKNTTVLCEIISPVNPIVLDYGGERRLVCLSAVDNVTGKDLPRKQVYRIFPGEHVKKIYDGESVSYAQAISQPVPNDEEGFVLEFQGSGLKAKVKGEDYLSAHKIMTNMSAKSLHESISEGKDTDLLETVRKTAPDRAYLMLSQARENMLAERDAKLEQREQVVKQALANYNAKHNADNKFVLSAADIPREKMGTFVEELRSVEAENNSSKSDFGIDIALAKGSRDRALEAVLKQQRPFGNVSIVSLVSAEEVEVGDDQDDQV